MVTVGIGPPKVLDAPKPTSSVKMSRTLGAPLGAVTSAGKSLTDSLIVRPILPLNGGSGRGRTSCAEALNAITTKAKTNTKIERIGRLVAIIANSLC